MEEGRLTHIYEYIYNTHTQYVNKQKMDNADEDVSQCCDPTITKNKKKFFMKEWRAL